MSEKETLINLTKCLLESIAEGNWKAYAGLCDPSLTCFEPEALGNLVEGMDFHHFYFQMERPASTQRIHTTLASPHVRLLGDTAIVCYVRLVQYVDPRALPKRRPSRKLVCGTSTAAVGCTFISTAHCQINESTDCPRRLG